MAISLPTTAAQPLPQTAAQLEALASRAGQVVEARVVGTGAGGTTQLSIGSQLVDAALPIRLQPDALIQLLVQGAAPNTRLTVLPQTAQASAGAQAQPQNVKTAVQSAAVSGPAKGPSSTPAHNQQQTQAGAIPQGTVQTSVPNARPALVPVPGSNALPQTTVPQSQAGTSAPQLVPVSTQAGQAAQLEAGTVFRLQLQGVGVSSRPVLVPVASPKSASASAPASAQNTAPVANPLQQAVTQTAQQAVTRQDSIATLLASLAGLGAKLANLPKPVAQGGAKLLSGRLNLDARPLDGAGLKQALARSGVLFENTLQKSSMLPLPQGDLKGALLGLRNELRLWLGGEAQTKSPGQQPPPPPTPGALPRAGKPAVLPMPAMLSNAETGARLLGQAEAALARIQLMQLSSLPDVSMRAGQGPAGSAQELNMELPMLFGGETSVGQFQIYKDGRKGRGGAGEQGWKMHFSINFSQTGEVGATVSLHGGKTAVMLWAEREETAEVLKECQGELEEGLAARGLEPGTIRCRHGIPPQARKPVGVYMDDCS